MAGDFFVLNLLCGERAIRRPSRETGRGMAVEFIQKLSSVRPIGDGARTALEAGFHDVKKVQKSDILFREGGPFDEVFIVKSGWFYSFALLPDGSRQIHEVFTTGDIIGLGNLSWTKAMTSVACAVSGEIYIASIPQIRTLIRLHPPLDDIFRILQMINNILLVDRLTAMSRLDAFNRIAFFLADALARQNLVTKTPTHILKMPLSQSLMADCLGLSSVHVSRQFGKLTEAGLVQKLDRRTVAILDVARLSREGHFKDRFAELIRDAISFSDISAPAGARLTVSNMTLDPRENPSF